MLFSTPSSRKKKKEKKLKGILRRRTDGEKKCIAMLVDYYDENQDKSLNKDEMKKMLRDLDSTHEPTDESLNSCLKLITGQEKDELWAENVMGLVQRYHSYWHMEDYYEQRFKKYEKDGKFKFTKDDLKTEMEALAENNDIIVEMDDVDIVMSTLTDGKVGNNNNYEKHQVKAALSQWKFMELEQKKDEENVTSTRACCTIM
jgi:hypothetical protein